MEIMLNIASVVLILMLLQLLLDLPVWLLALIWALAEIVGASI